jgi:hypothetical protein
MSRLGVLIATLVVGICLAGAGTALAANETVTVHATFTPDKLGSATNASGEAKIVSNIPGEIPSPVSGTTLEGPAGLSLELKGTGTCTEAILLGASGPEGCPRNSIAGFGGGQGALKLGTQIIEEPFTLDFFLGDNNPHHTVLLIYLNGVSPVSVQLVFSALVEKEPAPYGLGFHVNVPLIPTLPGASDASALSIHVTLGAPNVYYYTKVHGKRKRVHVKGLVLPKTCPKGGFKTNTIISFVDGYTSENPVSIPCPKRK